MRNFNTIVRSILLGTIAWYLVISCISVHAATPHSEKEKIEFLEKHLKEYFKDITTMKDGKKRREIIRLKGEMRRISLSVDPGHVRNEKNRSHIITIRRQAMREYDTDTWIIENFDQLSSQKVPLSLQFTGIPFKTSPWLDLSYAREKRAGDEHLALRYDITQGNASLTYEIQRTIPFPEYDAFVFELKGDVRGLQLEVTTPSSTHGYLLDGIEPHWKTFVIPYTSFSDYDKLLPQKIDRIVIMISPLYTQSLHGTMAIKKIALGFNQKQESTKEKTMSVSYHVEGGKPLGTNKSFFFQTPPKGKQTHQEENTP